MGVPAVSLGRLSDASGFFLAYAGKRKLTRRDQFLAQLEAVTPWSALMVSIEPFYPKGKGAGRPPIGLERMAADGRGPAMLRAVG